MKKILVKLAAVFYLVHEMFQLMFALRRYLYYCGMAVLAIFEKAKLLSCLNLVRPKYIGVIRGDLPTSSILKSYKRSRN